jgi:acetyl esterase/lipase
MRRVKTIHIAMAVVALALLIVAVLVIRRPLEILNALTPAAGYQLQSGLAYGDLPRQKLDVYRPTQPRATPAPVVVFFYGGGWSSGARGDYRFVGQRLAADGFTVIIPDYRLHAEVKFPAFLEDGAKALRWTQDHIAEFGGDPERLFLIGHSAGAYNAVMLALDRRYGAAAGFEPERIRGVVGLAGPYDFKLDTPLLKSVFGGAADPGDTQPVRFAAPGAPPMLLMTGDTDETVRPANSISLAEHLRAARSAVELREFPGIGHIDLLLQLAAFWHPRSAVHDEILTFLDRSSAGTP